MPADLREHRKEPYRVRAHPQVAADFLDRRDSFASVYLSLIPFLSAEYFAEVAYEFLPSGMVFPLGYLLFWAFYYTYYKPGFLEDRLSDPHRWDLAAIPTLFVGVLIWFFKITLVELSHLVFLRWVIPRAARAKPAPAKASAPHAAPNSGPHRPGPAAGPRMHQEPKRPASNPGPTTPPEILSALKTLGLAESAKWNDIHRRYRELAKKYHPDLNPELTEVARRFMLIDSAYRKLSSAKEKYFSVK